MVRTALLTDGSTVEVKGMLVRGSAVSFFVRTDGVLIPVNRFGGFIPDPPPPQREGDKP